MSEARHEAVMAALATVPEPCSIAMRKPTNLADMGLVESVAIDAGRVEVVLVLTDPSCVHFTAMQRYIEDVLGELDWVEEVAVSMSTTQLWTPDRVRSPAADAA